MRRVATIVRRCVRPIEHSLSSCLGTKLDLEDKAWKCRMEMQAVVDRQRRATWDESRAIEDLHAVAAAGGRLSAYEELQIEHSHRRVHSIAEMLRLRQSLVRAKAVGCLEEAMGERRKDGVGDLEQQQQWGVLLIILGLAQSTPFWPFCVLHASGPSPRTLKLPQPTNFVAPLPLLRLTPSLHTSLSFPCFSHHQDTSLLYSVCHISSAILCFTPQWAIERHWLGLEFAGGVQLQYPDSGLLDHCCQYTSMNPFFEAGESCSQPLARLPCGWAVLCFV